MPAAACDSNHSRGCWPDRGEYDIMEMVNGDGTAHGTYIWNAFFPSDVCGVTGWSEGGYASTRCSKSMAELAWDSEYNEYAIEWDGATYLALFVNGRLTCNLTTLIGGITHGPSTTIARVAPAGATEVTTQRPLFHADPVYLMLQTAVGGAWPGEPTPATALPALHYVDYVRVMARNTNRKGRSA